MVRKFGHFILYFKEVHKLKLPYEPLSKLMLHDRMLYDGRLRVFWYLITDKMKSLPQQAALLVPSEN